MAELPVNPSVTPVADPLFIGYSKSVEQPPAPQAGRILAEGFGKAGEQAVEGSDLFMKQSLQGSIEQQASGLRSDFISALDTAKSVMQNPLTSINGTPIDATTGTDKGGAVPDDIKNLSARAEKMKISRDNGKMTETDYYGKLDALAKEFRTRYPGYRDYIDNQFERVTGVKTANAYIRSKIADMDATVQAGKEFKNKLDTKLIDAATSGDHDFGPNALALLQRRRAGQASDDEVASSLARWNAKSTALAQKKAERDDVKGDAEERKRLGEEEASQRAAFLRDEYIYTKDGGMGSPAQITERILKMKPGESPQEAAALGESMARHGVIFKNKLIADMDHVDPVTHRSHTMDIGVAKRDEIVNSSMEYFNGTSKLVYDSNFGQANSADNYSKAVEADTKKSLFDDPSMGAYFRVWAAIGKMGVPPKWAEDYAKKWDTLDFDLKFRKFSQDLDMGIKTNMWLGKPADPNNPNSFTKNLDAAKTKAVDSYKLGPSLASKIYDTVMGGISSITSKTDSPAMKKNTADAAYGPANNDMMDRFKHDSIVDGRWKKGMNTYFNQFTERGITKEIFTKMDSDTQHKYIDWSENSFAKVNGAEIKDINEIASNPKIHIGWDTESNHWEVKVDGVPQSVLKNTLTNQSFGRAAQNNSDITDGQKILQATNRLNMGIDNMKHIAEYSGHPIAPYMVDVLSRAGIEGPAQKKMLDALNLANRPKEAQ